jgi:endonuclease YncB( thermonuclease family)
LLLEHILRQSEKRDNEANVGNENANSELQYRSNSSSKGFITSKYILCDVQDEDGYTRAMNACYREQVDLLKALVRAGANINVKAKNGMTLSQIMKSQTK